MATLSAAIRSALAWVATMLWYVPVFVLTLTGQGVRAWRYVNPRWGKTLARIVGLKVHAHGTFPKRQVIFAMNHTAGVDVIVAPIVLPTKVRMVVKKELGQVPFFGWALRNGCIFIDRTKGAEAQALIDLGRQTLPDDWSMLMFPEGTRSPTGKMLPLKKGIVHLARQTGADVIPVGVAGAYESMPTGAWLARASEVHVVFGEPLSAEAWKSKELDTCMEELRSGLQKAIDQAEGHRQSAAA